MVEDRPQEPQSSSPARVLFIVPHADLRDISLESVSEALGVTYQHVQTTEEATRVLSTERFDIIVVSMELTASSGRLIADELRDWAQNANLYILVAARRESLMVRLKDGDLNADDFVLLPASEVLLFTRLRLAMRQVALGQVRRSAEQKEAILATVMTLAHAINNPLCAIQGNLMLMRDEIENPAGNDVDREELIKSIDTLDTQVERIAESVRRLQALKRPQVVSYLGRMSMVSLENKDASSAVDRTPSGASAS